MDHDVDVQSRARTKKDNEVHFHYMEPSKWTPILLFIFHSVACLQTITLLGPMFGFLLGSYCAKLYVDIGYVDMGR